jgi:hypothetical protein
MDLDLVACPCGFSTFITGEEGDTHGDGTVGGEGDGLLEGDTEASTDFLIGASRATEMEGT